MTFLKRIVSAAALSVLLGLPSAQAGYVVTLQEMGNDVVATGSGALDLTSLVGASIPIPTSSFIDSGNGQLQTGLDAPVDWYGGGVIDDNGVFHPTITGPMSFGDFGGTGDFSATSATGPLVGIWGLSKMVVVPLDYISDTPVANSATWANHTFSSLQVAPGTYVWTWGTGVNQNFTLIIGATAVPEPASLALLGTALAGLLLVGTIRKPRASR